MGGRQVYVSYSRRADFSFIKKLISAELKRGMYRSCVISGNTLSLEKLETTTTENENFELWDVIHDETLKPGDSINAFMERLSEGERLVFLLSKGYFHSRFCMHELFAIFNKRAESLLPVVVFVDGFNPTPTLEEELVIYWENEKNTADNEQIAAAYQKFIDQLPLALVWLLGPFDSHLTYYQHLYIHGENGNSVGQVQAALAKEYSLRYRLPSQFKRMQSIREKVKQLVGTPSLKEAFDALRMVAAQEGNCSDLSEYLCMSSRPEEVMERYYTIHNWLEKLAGSDPSRMNAAMVSVKAKELVGWLFLLVIDEKKLRRLVHELNHAELDGHLRLAEDNDCAFQFIASALSEAPVRFKMASDGNRLYGEGQLCLIERGVSRMNYYPLIEDELKWGAVFTGLYGQLHELYHDRPVPAQEHRTEKQYMDAIKGLLRLADNSSRAGHYLLFEHGNISVNAKGAGFREKLSIDYPLILQIIADDSATGIDQYLLPNLSVGELYEVIKAIYYQIQRLANG